MPAPLTPGQAHSGWARGRRDWKRGAVVKAELAAMPQADKDFLRAWTELSANHKAVVRARCAGVTNAALARELEVAVQTVRNTLWGAFRTLLGSPSERPVAGQGERLCYLVGRMDAALERMMNDE